MATAALGQTAPGRMIDAGGYRVHLNCTGQGSPTVVLIGGFSFNWALVQAQIAKVTRVCSYDAAGMAWSDRAPGHDCEEHTEEIYRVLRNGRADPPYVLVGFSIGALYARLFAKEHERDLAAMVIVDHAFEPPKAAPPSSVADGPDSPPAVIYAPQIEIGIEDEPGYAKMPADMQALQRWAMARNPDLPNAEVAADCIRAVGSASLSNLPLVVVSTDNDTRGYSQLQSQLMALSTRSTQLRADRSFHSIQISESEIVIRAILMALEPVTK
jgi:pimeloyl-ACP methyl ester carboxylesterase